MAETRLIHGHNVTFEENAHDGIRYLRDDLDHAEAQVYFDQAKMNHAAEFEDKYNHQYTLVHEGENYVLLRR